MLTRDKQMLDLTAEDLMTHAVVAIPQHATLRAAAQLLAGEHISGVPVVDADGRCVGILSATDFLGLWIKGYQLGDDRVAKHMTADPVMVAPGTSLATLARMMIDAHIHRAVVVDAEQRPIGLVSTTDILAAVTYQGALR